VGDPIFGLVAQGAKRAVLGDRVFDYAVDRFSKFSIAVRRSTSSM
jgi:hypothetical protein